MHVNEYHDLAMRTRNPALPPEERLQNAALGIVGEGGEFARLVADAVHGDPLTDLVLRLSASLGELADAVKKGRHHGHPLTREDLLDLMAGHYRAVDEALRTMATVPMDAAPVAFAPDLDLQAWTILAVKEDGDIAWYTVQACDALGIRFDHVLHTNIAKLRARYPDGFDPARSLSRTHEHGPAQRSQLVAFGVGGRVLATETGPDGETVITSMEIDHVSMHHPDQAVHRFLTQPIVFSAPAFVDDDRSSTRQADVKQE